MFKNQLLLLTRFHNYAVFVESTDSSSQLDATHKVDRYPNPVAARHV
jgi:hypothetical protein